MIDRAVLLNSEAGPFAVFENSPIHRETDFSNPVGKLARGQVGDSLADGFVDAVGQ